MNVNQRSSASIAAPPLPQATLIVMYECALTLDDGFVMDTARPRDKDSVAAATGGGAYQRIFPTGEIGPFGPSGCREAAQPGNGPA